MWERDREGLPWIHETAKARICDIADRWKDANPHFGVSLEESHSNSETEVGSLSNEDEKSGIEFISYLCCVQGDSVLVLYPLVPRYLPVKWELLDFLCVQSDAKFYSVCKNRGPFRGGQSIQPRTSRCAPRECQWWHSWEQGRGFLHKCLLSPSSPSHHLTMTTAKGTGCIKTFPLPTLLLKKGIREPTTVNCVFNLPAVPVSQSSSNSDHPATLAAAAGE